MQGRVAREAWGRQGRRTLLFLSGLALRPDPNGSAAVDVCRYDYRHANCTDCRVQGTSHDYGRIDTCTGIRNTPPVGPLNGILPPAGRAGLRRSSSGRRGAKSRGSHGRDRQCTAGPQPAAKLPADVAGPLKAALPVAGSESNNGMAVLLEPPSAHPLYHGISRAHGTHPRMQCIG